MSVFCIFCVSDGLRKGEKIENLYKSDLNGETLCGWHRLKYPKSKRTTAIVQKLILKLRAHLPNEPYKRRSELEKFKSQLERFTAKYPPVEKPEEFDLDTTDDEE